jgi:hypothetical protein
VFEWAGDVWIQVARLKASDAAANDNFGLNVDVD